MSPLWRLRATLLRLSGAFGAPLVLAKRALNRGLEGA
jgi:hypothetical protein